MGFIPSLLKKRLTERCSSLVHVASGAAVFTLLLRRHLAFLHLTTTCRPLFNPSVSLLSTYKTIELCFEFLSHFLRFSFGSPSYLSIHCVTNCQLISQGTLCIVRHLFGEPRPVTVHTLFGAFGQSSWYSVSLRAGRFGVRAPV
jgi:hypothetical protein